MVLVRAFDFGAELMVLDGGNGDPLGDLCCKVVLCVVCLDCLWCGPMLLCPQFGIVVRCVVTVFVVCCCAAIGDVCIGGVCLDLVDL